MLRICSRVLRPRNISACKTERTFSSSGNVTDDTANLDHNNKSVGFARSFAEQEKIINPEPVTNNATFASLLRSSKFIDMGDPQGKIVKGEITHVVNDDLYIDFGWKFYCVCPKPNRNPELYVRGAKVRLLIKDLELSTRFLGSDTDLTLLEADCKLLNLLYSPAKR